MYCWIHFASILFRITLLCLPNALHCFFSCCFKNFLRTLHTNIASTQFLPLQFCLFLCSSSQFYNLAFLQQIYNLLCPFSIDSMNMCLGLSTWKCWIYAESLFLKDTDSLSAATDLVEILQSLSSCQLVISLCCMY